MPRLVVQQGAAGVGRERDLHRLALRLRLGLVLVADDRAPVELEPERGQAEVVGRGDGERDRGHRRDVGPTPTARSVTRGSRSRSRPTDRNAGRESSPVCLETSETSSVVASRRVQLVAKVLSSMRFNGGVLPDWIFRRASDSGSVPTRVISTSVSGRKTRCWRGSSTLRNPL